MIQIQHKTDCSGCGGCRQVCPTGCISYLPDGEGFFYPAVDTERCIRCGKCERACPMPAAKPQEHPADAFACRSKDISLRDASSSGGVFTALAEQILAEGGVVFGALLREDGAVAHAAVTDRAGLARLRGSKYVQSDMGNCFLQAQALLEKGRWVLFSGTPCQIYGLSCFLGREYDRLLLVDTVCMGVPSPGIWERYRRAQEERAGSRLTAAHFRDKGFSGGDAAANGWQDYAMRLEFENGTRYCAPRLQDPYLSCFLKRLDLRPACHACRFKGDARRSDLTLGDYWGIESLHPDWADGHGVSLVLARTPKGGEWLRRAGSELEVRPAPAEHAVRTHPSLVRSVEAASGRDAFFSACERGGDILPVLTRYGAPTAAERLRRMAGRLLRALGLRH